MTNSQARDSFIFYRSFYEAIQDLPKENQLELYNAIAQYSLNFEDPKLNGLSNTIFKLIKPQLEANRQRYLNGKKPKNNQKESKEEAKKKQKRSKEEANKNVNENKNENKNNNENKLTIQKENPFADMTKEFLQARYEQMGRSKPIAQKDFDNIRKLIEIDLKNRDDPVNDVKKAMQSVLDNSGKEFFVVVESSKAFREKFFKIENYKNKKTEKQTEAEKGDAFLNEYLDSISIKK
tara:strand:- start:2038 stop:2745 length:708 start_codon:yes stop_codon:yes gene_type:complete